MEKLEEKDFDELKKILEKEKEGIFNGKIKDIDYEINLNKPLRVILKDSDNYFEFYGGKLAHSKIDIEKVEKRAHYRKKNVFNVGFTITKTISVKESTINSMSFISEKYVLREQFDDSMIPKKCDKVIEDIAKANNNIKNIKDGEFCKEPIESNQELVEIINSEEELMKYLVEGSKTKLGDFPAGFYEDRHDFEFNKKSKNYKDKEVKDYDYYMTIAKEHIKEYKEIYKTIDKFINGEKNTEEIAEKIIEGHKDETKENIDQEEKNNDNIENAIDELATYLGEEQQESGIQQEGMITEENDAFEDLQEIVNELENKKKEEEKQRRRMNKINKAKELMLISKELDNEIMLIENEQEEGEN